MLARNVDGEWLPLEQVQEFGPGGFEQLVGGDLARLLGLEQPYLVAGYTPDLPGSPDALCITPDGSVAVVVSSFGRDRSDVVLGMIESAAALHDLEPADLLTRCAKLQGATSPGAWLAAQVEGVDAAHADEAIAESLSSGEFELIAVTPAGPGELAPVLRYLDRGPAEVRCFELEIHQAGTVQVCEATDSGIDGSDDLQEAPTTDSASWEPVQRSTDGFEPVATQPSPEPTPEPVTNLTALEPTTTFTPIESATTFQPMSTEAELAPDATAELAADVESPVTAEAEFEPSVELEAELTADPAEPLAEAEADSATEPQTTETSGPDENAVIATETEFLNACKAFTGWKLVQHFTHGAVPLFDEVDWERKSDRCLFYGWVERGNEAVLMLELDSAGALVLHLGEFADEQRTELVSDLTRTLDTLDTATLATAERVEISLVEQLGDETLIDFLVSSLGDGLGRSHDEPTSQTDDTLTGDDDATGDDTPGDGPQGDGDGDWFAEPDPQESTGSRLPWPRRQAKQTSQPTLNELRRRKAS